MKACPECGAQSPEDAKFCESCGRGLDDAADASPKRLLPPLEPGTELQNGLYQIVELLAQNSFENSYRAKHLRVEPQSTILLREQLARPAVQDSDGSSESEDTAAAAEDPAGPRAKTAELRLPPVESQNGAAAATEADRAKLPDAEAQPPQAQFAGTAGAESAGDPAPGAATGLEEIAADTVGAAHEEAAAAGEMPDLGERFGRVLALSMTLEHPAIARASSGFGENGRVYLVYPDDHYTTLAARPGGLEMDESEALSIAIQVCQAVGFVHRRGMRVNDIWPESVAYAPNGRIRLLSLDEVSNDNEAPDNPALNDGYTAPEVYRGKAIDKRADIFSIGALLYSCLTGERLEAESWREEAGPIRFYPPHVVTPALEQIVRKALQFAPAARWPTVDAFKDELLKLFNQVTIRAAVSTDVGMVRELNEDSVLALEYQRDSLLDPARHYLYVIADGMGGAEAGEVASAIAVGAMRDYIEEQFRARPVASLDAALCAAIEMANRKVLEYAASHPEARGLGSTAVACVSAPPEAAIAWVGDSRAYLSQENGLRQLSKDHSLVQRLIEIGQITPEEARHHEHKNVITRSLGARQKGPAGAESVALRLRRGDRMLLCSDGLTAHVTDAEIARIMRVHREPEDAARELVAAANAGGGTDNVSVAVIFAV